MNGMNDWIQFYQPEIEKDPMKKKNAMYAAALGGVPGMAMSDPYAAAESGMMGLLPKLVGGENLKKASNLGGFGVLGKLFG